ncbi:hypothetical protein JRQ81_007528 [Phrynocephalus forsythii]|uniref:Uncharacterized protein n=1 Tax=Phrynocephalus forsythii TaxID=171643 RepID=A0A9Q0XDA5_9SAUR|nr:hypothetical protein JRQ81_007528 [Phrynocephalus forsythii]
MEVSYGSSVPEYSQDTFTSSNEEEEGESYGSYENDPFESYSSGEKSGSPLSLDRSESPWQSSSPKDEVEQSSELLNIPPVEEQLLRKWISLLKDKVARTKVAKTATEPDKGVYEVSEEERGARQSFCAVKIKQLRPPPSSTLLKRNWRNDQRHGGASEKRLACDLNCVVPDQLANRIYLKNLKETVKQIAETEMHEPSQCFPCTEKRAELAKFAFLRRRKTMMEEFLLREKLEDLMYSKDSLTLIGEIHRTLPKLSDHPKILWEKLNKRCLKASSATCLFADIN